MSSKLFTVFFLSVTVFQMMFQTVFVTAAEEKRLKKPISFLFWRMILREEMSALTVKRKSKRLFWTELPKKEYASRKVIAAQVFALRHVRH
jgi:hypothetical protein